MKALVEALPVVKNPGRVYRPMYCNSCEGVRYHRVDFIAAERNLRGRFVWFTKKCTGHDAIDNAHPKRLLKRQKPCEETSEAELPITQWDKLIAGDYY